MGVSFVQDSDRVQTGSVGESSSEKWERGQQGWDAEPSAEGFRLPLGMGQRDVWANTADTPCVPATPLLIPNPRSQGWKTMCHFFFGGALPMQRGFYLFLKCFTCSFVHFFIYLAAPGLSCNLRDPSAVACTI